MYENTEENTDIQERLETLPFPFYQHTLFQTLIKETSRDSHSTERASFGVKEIAAEDNTNDNKEESYKRLRGLGLQRMPTNLLEKRMDLLILDIRANKLKIFPYEITQLLNLKVLLLDNNGIEYIPSYISQMQNLEVLSMAGNEVTMIEEGLTKLSKLQKLQLNDNRIESWPGYFCSSLLHLKVLYLHGNNDISGIPFSFDKLKTLIKFGFDWLLYLPAVKAPTIKGAKGRRFLKKMRKACKYFREQNQLRQGSVRKTSALSFIDFISWFSDSEASPLQSYFCEKRQNPLHLSALWGHTSIVSKILSTDIDLNCLDEEGLTPLILALVNSQFEAASLLLSNPRIDLTLCHPKFGSVLIIAIIKGQFGIAEQMLNCDKINPNARDVHNITVLHYIFSNFSTNPTVARKLCSILLEKFKCNLNLVNDNGMSPLHCAAKKKAD
eukprot:TRINITY_DN26396_c0_g1_i1.p1 TRINITY_DN26396_c0_g1~~TRINITY_DN26396_c0_g1_i1.p1  ORF type:complete len:440 (-),score=31.98 TRINITY_DN26396_c0_g1_i1:367-1686(-)